jgi:hypothetical protein
VRRLAPLGVLALALNAVAAPTVEVKAMTALVLEKVRLQGDGAVEVIGYLVDKLTNEGIPHQFITVKLGDDQGHANTTADGKFRVVMDAQRGTQPIELRYDGGNLLDRAEFKTVTDPSRQQVTLAIRTEDAPGGTNVIVGATVDDRPTELTIQLSVGAPSDAELKELATITSGKPFVLTRAKAGGPGPRRIRASFAGDDDRQTATTEATIELTSATTTTMEIASQKLAYEDDLVVRGKVTDEDGKPVARAAVTLTSGDKRLAQGATGADGSYRFSVEAEILGQGQFGVQVQSDPGSSYVRGSRSAPVIVRIAAPQPVPVSYTVAAFIATALAAGGFFTARAKPWQRFRRPAPPAEAKEGATERDEAVGGLVVAKPGIVSTLRRPYDDGFSGVVRDTVRGRPVPEAVVSLGLAGDAGGDERSVRTHADGTFALEKLAVGEWRAEVAAPGHVTERFMVSIPHRGELRGVRVDLVPVRERVFQLYRRAAEPILPEARLWGIWSPRQVVDHVRSKRPSPALAELTDFVEEVYFSARIADETVLPAASEQVDRAIRERARTAS